MDYPGIPRGSGHKLTRSMQMMAIAPAPSRDMSQNFAGYVSNPNMSINHAHTISTRGTVGGSVLQPFKNIVPAPARDAPGVGGWVRTLSNLRVSNNPFSAPANSLPIKRPPLSRFDERQQIIQDVKVLLEELRQDNHPDSVKALAEISASFLVSNEKEKNAEREFRAFRGFMDGYKSWNSFPPDDPNAKINPWVTFGEVNGLVCFHVEEGMKQLIERMEGLEATVGLKDTSPKEPEPYGGTFQRSFMRIDNTIVSYILLSF